MPANIPPGSVPFMMWMKPEEREKLRELGGARWLRKMINDAPADQVKRWSTLHERNRNIVMDIRPSKFVARDYGLSMRTVQQMRAQAKLMGRPVAVFQTRKKETQ